jgi:hypothetical protein
LVQRFFKALVQILTWTKADDLPPFATRFDRIFESLSKSDLQTDADFSAESILGDLFSAPDERGRELFLGFYSEEGAKLAFERYGFFDMLRKQGFRPLLVGDVSDPNEHRLQIYDAKQSVDHLVVELVSSYRSESLPGHANGRYLFINWLLMQNPYEDFAESDHPLPGQEHPGLGLFLYYGYLLRLMAIRLGCDGLMNHPSYFHNGVLYGKISHFVDPDIEGRFLALERDLRHLDLAEASNVVRDGHVVDQRGVVFEWQPAPQIHPISPSAMKWFSSKSYSRAVRIVRDSTHFTVGV